MKSVTIENHLESLTESSVIWERYTRDAKANPNRYFVFYEGKDRQYYDCRIRNFTKNYNAYEVGGKSKVLQLVDKFTHEEGYKLKNKLFLGTIYLFTLDTIYRAYENIKKGDFQKEIVF